MLLLNRSLAHINEAISEPTSSFSKLLGEKSLLMLLANSFFGFRVLQTGPINRFQLPPTFFPRICAIHWIPEVSSDLHCGTVIKPPLRSARTLAHFSTTIKPLPRSERAFAHFSIKPLLRTGRSLAHFSAATTPVWLGPSGSPVDSISVAITWQSGWGRM